MSFLTLARRLIAAAATLMTAAGAFWSAYMAAISAGALLKSKAPVIGTEPPDTFFRIIVPAHNEEHGLGATLESLSSLDYPDHLYEVHVVADNCTDQTASVARNHDARVYERTDTAHRGKGAALVWLIDQLPEIDDSVLVVIDADCVVAPDMLSQFHIELPPYAAVQGHTRIDGADSGGALGFRAAAFSVRNYLRPLGRLGLGGSSFLFGTGMAIRESVVRSHAWSNELAEDLEFSARLLLDGETIGFARNAELVTAMPTSLEESESQHERWTAGRRNVASRWIPDLLRAAVARRHRRSWAYIDAAVDLSMPALSVQVLVTFAGGILSVVGTRGRLRRWLVGVAVTALVTVVAHVLHALRATQAPAGVYRSLALAPRNLVWQAKILIRTRMNRPGTWVRTPRDSEST